MNGIGGRKSGLILSGGGADSAYGVGVIKALAAGQSPVQHGRPLDPEVITGTSAGAYNAALLTAESEKTGFARAVSRLEEAWIEQLSADATSCGNGVYRLRGYPPEYLRPYCLLTQPVQEASEFVRDTAFLAVNSVLRAFKFAAEQGPIASRIIDITSLEPFVSIEPFAESIGKTIDFSAVPQARRRVRVVATNWTNGQLQVFKNHELNSSLGTSAVMASAALPGIFPPVEIDGQLFVDGGLLMNTPLSLAIKAGADDLYVIYFDPNVQNIPIQVLSSTIDAFYRSLVILWASLINRDVELAEFINRTILTLRRRAAGMRDRADVQGQLRNILEAPAGRTFRLLNIHLFHPKEDLGELLGFLNFDRKRIESLIERGYQDALRHDCGVSNCVLAEEGN